MTNTGMRALYLLQLRGLVLQRRSHHGHQPERPACCSTMIAYAAATPQLIKIDNEAAQPNECPGHADVHQRRQHTANRGIRYRLVGPRIAGQHPARQVDMLAPSRPNPATKLPRMGVLL
ncbi:MAG: hypothetical protein U0Z44_04890 [Kouleothrix sp.]